eukprot:CFRG6867T1
MHTNGIIHNQASTLEYIASWKKTTINMVTVDSRRFFRLISPSAQRMLGKATGVAGCFGGACITAYVTGISYLFLIGVFLIVSVILYANAKQAIDKLARHLREKTRTGTSLLPRSLPVASLPVPSFHLFGYSTLNFGSTGKDKDWDREQVKKVRTDSSWSIDNLLPNSNVSAVPETVNHDCTKSIPNCTLSQTAIDMEVDGPVVDDIYSQTRTLFINVESHPSLHTHVLPSNIANLVMVRGIYKPPRESVSIAQFPQTSVADIRTRIESIPVDSTTLVPHVDANYNEETSTMVHVGRNIDLEEARTSDITSTNSAVYSEKNARIAQDRNGHIMTVGTIGTDGRAKAGIEMSAGVDNSDDKDSASDGDMNNISELGGFPNLHTQTHTQTQPFSTYRQNQKVTAKQEHEHTPTHVLPSSLPQSQDNALLQLNLKNTLSQLHDIHMDTDDMNKTNSTGNEDIEHVDVNGSAGVNMDAVDEGGRLHIKLGEKIKNVSGCVVDWGSGEEDDTLSSTSFCEHHGERDSMSENMTRGLGEIASGSRAVRESAKNLSFPRQLSAQSQPNSPQSNRHAVKKGARGFTKDFDYAETQSATTSSSKSKSPSKVFSCAEDFANFSKSAGQGLPLSRTPISNTKEGGDNEVVNVCLGESSSVKIEVLSGQPNGILSRGFISATDFKSNKMDKVYSERKSKNTGVCGTKKSSVTRGFISASDYLSDRIGHTNTDSLKALVSPVLNGKVRPTRTSLIHQTEVLGTQAYENACEYEPDITQYNHNGRSQKQEYGRTPIDTVKSALLKRWASASASEGDDDVGVGLDLSTFGITSCVSGDETNTGMNIDIVEDDFSLSESEMSESGFDLEAKPDVSADTGLGTHDGERGNTDEDNNISSGVGVDAVGNDGESDYEDGLEWPQQSADQELRLASKWDDIELPTEGLTMGMLAVHNNKSTQTHQSSIYAHEYTQSNIQSQHTVSMTAGYEDSEDLDFDGEAISVSSLYSHPSQTYTCTHTLAEENTNQRVGESGGMVGLRDTEMSGLKFPSGGGGLQLRLKQVYRASSDCGDEFDGFGSSDCSEGEWDTNTDYEDTSYAHVNENTHTTNSHLQTIGRANATDTSEGWCSIDSENCTPKKHTHKDSSICHSPRVSRLFGCQVDTQLHDMYQPRVPLNTRLNPNLRVARPSKLGEGMRIEPMLIQSTKALTDKQIVGSMVYNPVTQSWEGNEEALLDFDENRAPSNSRPIPALIAPLGSSAACLPKIVNGMVFDPDRACWRGNEEDILDWSDSDFSDSDENESNIICRIDTNETSSIVAVAEIITDTDFAITPELAKMFNDSEQQHRDGLNGWNATAHIRALDTSNRWAIRTMR